MEEKEILEKIEDTKNDLKWIHDTRNEMIKMANKYQRIPVKFSDFIDSMDRILIKLRCDLARERGE